MKAINTLHGCAVVLGSHGIFIRGKSGSGKSRLGHQLIADWQRNNLFARWVGDDRVIIHSHKTGLIARPPTQIQGLAEQRFVGIETVLYEDSVRLDFIVELVPIEKIERLPQRDKVTLIKNAAELPIIYAPEKNSELAFEIVRASFDKNHLQLRVGM